MFRSSGVRCFASPKWADFYSLIVSLSSDGTSDSPVANGSAGGAKSTSSRSKSSPAFEDNEAESSDVEGTGRSDESDVDQSEDEDVEDSRKKVGRRGRGKGRDDDDEDDDEEEEDVEESEDEDDWEQFQQESQKVCEGMTAREGNFRCREYWTDRIGYFGTSVRI